MYRQQKYSSLSPFHVMPQGIRKFSVAKLLENSGMRLPCCVGICGCCRSYGEQKIIVVAACGSDYSTFGQLVRVVVVRFNRRIFGHVLDQLADG